MILSFEGIYKDYYEDGYALRVVIFAQFQASRPRRIIFVLITN